MMEFDELERRMLRDMVQLHKSQNLCVYSWLSKLFDDRISFSHVSNSRQYDCAIEIKSNELEINEILTKLKYFYFLYRRLEKMNLIDMDRCHTVDFKFVVFEGHEFTLGASSEIILYNFLSMWGYHSILLSHYLTDLVDNNFKTTELRRFEKQLEVTNANHNVAMDKARKQINIAWGAFGVSLITLIFSFGFGIWEKYGETKIDQSQLNQIKQTIEQKTLPEVFKTEITNDTLTTKVVEMPIVKPTIQSK